MIHRARRAYFALLPACVLSAIPCFAADAQWVKARLGPFETISDTGRHSAIQALSQFEQFRFALGTAMGKPDLRLDPPLRIMVFKNTQEMPPGCDTVHQGRERVMACVANEAQLPPALVREMTARLLEENFSNIPVPIEQALETFFSTVQSNAVHVTWGAPPPHDERTREWALIHRLITQPDYAGRAHIYLHNLAEGMDSNGAVRSLSEDPKTFNAEIDRYYAAGVFTSAQAPNRPLNPDRDFNTVNLTTDEGQLARADLLTPGSEAIYQALLKAGKQVAESNEGLAILALRSGDQEQARHYMEAARSAGTHNVVALTEYGKTILDEERAQAVLKEALTIDPKYAEAHWVLGEKIFEMPRRLAEWKQAVALAPRRFDWWARYAQLCQHQKQYAEAGRAWLAAAQNAPTPEQRELYLASRGQIDQLRLDDEETERRKAAAARAAEIEALKNKAKKELADAEARYSTKPLTKDEAAKVVDWTDINGSGRVNGSLTKVTCVNRQVQLEVKDEMGKSLRLLIPDPAQISILGGDGTLTCGGAQKPRPATITFRPTPADKKGFTGEVTGIEFH
jgi:Tfp pilus assembly protein PilF